MSNNGLIVTTSRSYEYMLSYIFVTNIIFDLSHNNFTGKIPTSIGSISDPRFLNLSGRENTYDSQSNIYFGIVGFDP